MASTVTDPRFPAHSLEHLRDVRCVQGSAELCREDQPFVLPVFPGRTVLVSWLSRHSRSDAAAIWGSASVRRERSIVNNRGTRGDHVVAPAGHDGMTLGVM